VENPKLESMHLELLRTEEELKSKLHTSQENVLKDLADARGNILENQVSYRLRKPVSVAFTPICFFLGASKFVGQHKDQQHGHIEIAGRIVDGAKQTGIRT